MAPKRASHSASAASSGREPSPEKFSRRQRDKIVSKIRCGSVESKIKTDFGGRFFEGFKKSVCRLHIQTVRRDDDGDFIFGLGWFELNFAHQLPRLVNRHDARFGFRPRPVHVGVRFVVDFPAAWAGVAAIRGCAAGFDRFLAVEGFGECAGEQFQFFKLVAGKQVGVSQPPARQRALEQLNAPRLLWKMFECHFDFKKQLAEPKLCWPASRSSKRITE